MITPGLHNFTLYQGTTLRKTFTWMAGENVMDLTGYTGRCQFRQSIQDQVVALDMTSDNDGIIIDGVAGTITLYATDEQTAALILDRYVYDLEVIDAVGDVSRLIYGTVTMVKEVTR